MFFNTFKRILVPFISLTIMVFGNGLINTLTTLRLSLDDYSSQVIGFVAAGYYIGLVIGSFNLERFVVKVGHIRAYAAFASTLAVASILLGFWVHPIYWFFIRVVTGYCLAGLYIVIESWFMSASEVKMRGQILAMYMVSYYGAYAGGQYLLKLGNPLDTELFTISAMLASLSVIPLACMQVTTPAIAEPEQMGLKKLFSISKSAFIGGVVGGQTNSIITSLLPVYIESNGHPELISQIMALTIIGGMLFQYPIGRFSDKFDRRLMLMFIFLVTGTIALMCYLMNPIQAWYMEFMFCILGGAVFAIYPISISLMCDRVSHDRTIAATQGMLLAYGIGSVSGPLLAPLFISDERQLGMFLFMAIICFATIIIISGRVIVDDAPPADEKQDYVPTPPVQSATVSELDPRGELEQETTYYDKC